MMNEFEGKLEKLTRLTKAFEQADDSNKRSHLANELLCTLENTTLSARRYYSSFLKPEKHGRETHILPYHVEEHCAVEVTRDGWTHICCRCGDRSKAAFRRGLAHNQGSVSP